MRPINNSGVFFILIIACVSLNMKGQATFQKIYPSTVSQSGRDVLHMSDGGYLIAGMTINSIPGDSDIYVLKTNSTGDTLWTKTYGGNKPDYAYTLLQTNDNNYFMAGFTMSFGSGKYDMYLLKIDTSGNLLWTKTYGGTGDDQAKEIIATSDGNYIMTGRSNSPGNLNYDMSLMKIDPEGNVLWTKNYGGPLYETAHSVKQCNDGGYILAGQTYSYGNGGGDVWLVKTNSSGDTTWTKTYGGAQFDEGNYVLANIDGTFIIDAETNSFGAGDLDVNIFKTDSAGNLIWTKTYGGDKKDVSHMIQATMDGGYFISAISRSFGWINPNMWLIKINSIGDVMWTRQYGSWYHEHSYAARQNPDGSYIAIGHSEDAMTETHIMLVKLDPDGTTGFEQFSSNNTYHIFPNPSNGIITIKLKEVNAGNISFKITNTLGQVVFSDMIDPLAQDKTRIIDLKNNEPGIYFVSVLTGRNLTTSKIILR